ncbi:MAG TPA: hypothetical protein VD738_11700 [Nitrospira sp.]|jgi:hypothetical protein|nr:hypothetical protein [Nitrospira sp.]
MVHDASSYRVTLFFGPEPVDGDPRAEACVFNVKRRSWRAGIQISVEIATDQLSTLRRKIQLSDRLLQAFLALAPEERAACEDRLGDLFAQAVSRCKLDLRLQSGLSQDNGRIPAGELVPELEQAITGRPEYVVAYILAELDLAHEHPSPSSL